MFVHPAEVVALRGDLSVRTVVLDVRDEHDFNLFHVGGARRVDAQALLRPEAYEPLLDAPASTVTFLVGNGEATALEAWKALTGVGVPNLYVVEGGLNRWLELYPVPECVARRTPAAEGDALAFRFAYATGEREPAAWPERAASRLPRVCPAPGGGALANAAATWPAHPFEKRVKLKTRVAVKGGCG
jgi:hypothetical protein